MIKVSLDPRKFNRWLNNAAQKQVPFATARALTNLAKVGQVALRADINRSMTIRNNWTAKGIQVKAAQKRDGLNNMQAEVGSKDWYMADQLADETSTRQGNSGRKQFLPYAARGKGKGNLIPKRLRPAPVTQSAKAGNGGDGKFFFRKGRGGRSMVFQNLRGNKLRLMYTVGKSQTVKPKMHLTESVRKSVMPKAEREFIRQMQAAIRSAS